MVPKALGLTLLSALQKRQDAQCSDYCPFGTMSLQVAPTKVIVQQPIRVTGYFATNGLVTVGADLVATITGAPGVLDTVITFVRTETQTGTITVCPSSQVGSSTGSPTPQTSGTGGSGQPSSQSNGGSTSGNGGSSATATTSGPSSGSTGGASTTSTDNGSATSANPGSSSNSESGTGGNPQSTTSTDGNPGSSGSATTGPSTGTPGSTTSGNGGSTGPESTGPPSSSASTGPSSSGNGSSTTAPGASTSSTSNDGSGTSSTGPSSTSSTDGSGSTSSSSTGGSSATSTSSSNAGSSVSSQTTSSGTTTPTCIPSPLPTVCATSLPQACENLGQSNGLALVPLVPICTAALGVFGGGKSVACLAAASIDISTTGASLVACLRAAIADICISKLPDACIAIKSGTVTSLPQNIASCTTDLGPFAVGTALGCLNQALQDPAQIFSCLLKSIGLVDPAQVCSTTGVPTVSPTASSTGPNTSGGSTSQPTSGASSSSTGGSTGSSSATSSETSAGNTSTGPTSSQSSSSATSPGGSSTTGPPATSSSGTSTTGSSSSSCVPTTPPKVCVTSLPQACSALKSVNGLPLVPLVPLCTAAFSSLSTAETKACLAVNIGLGTIGADITSCLEAAVPNICISALPQSCLSIPTTSVLDLPSKVAACTTDLGPFAVDTATKCLQKAISDPLNVLLCLRSAIGLGDPNGGCSSTSQPTSISTSSANPSSSSTPASTTPASSQTGESSSSTTLNNTPSTTASTSKSTTSSSPVTSTTASTTTTKAPSSSSCVPSPTGPAPSACVTALPQACSQLEKTNGLALLPALTGCAVALGPYAAGNTLTCLSTSAIGITTTGKSIVNCLLTSLKDRCITTLPGSCKKLSSDTGLSLIPDVALCVTALGPFAVGSALTCLATGQITDSTTGVSIITCLETALGLRAPTPTGGGGLPVCSPTTPQPTACPATLPPSCKSLSTDKGLQLLISIPLCVSALGTYAVGNAAQCLATETVSVSTVGSDIVTCLTTALTNQCPKSLPSACTNIETDPLANLAADIPLCVAALGPYAAGDALKCLSTSTGTGAQIVSCLRNALGIIV